MKETREYRTDISFIILHYNVVDETINCVNSIKNNINSNNYHIVIADNASPNKSGDILLNNLTAKKCGMKNSLFTHISSCLY